MKILLVTCRFPWPPRRGDQLRAVQMAELLAPEHEVTLLVPEPSPADTASEIPPGVHLETYRRTALDSVRGLAAAALCGLPFQSGLFGGRGLRRALRRLAPRADLVILQLARLAGHLGDCGTTAVLVDLIDSLALNFRQRAGLGRGLGGALARPVLLAEAARLERCERRLVEGSAGALVVCERDRQAMAGWVPEPLLGKVSVLPLAFPLRSGSEPAPVEPAPLDSAEKQPNLVLTGNLGYAVTVDAACWWLEEVWPRLRAKRPELRLVLAGARPARAVRRAARRHGATLLDSPPDLRAVLASATVAIAPLRGGAGQPLKVLEAWEQGVPVVASPRAAAGTTAVPGRDLLVASSAEEWVAAAEALLDDPDRCRELAASATARLRADYGREGLRERLLAVVSVASRADRGSGRRIQTSLASHEPPR